MTLPLLLALAACSPAPADAEGRDSQGDSPSPDNLDQDGDGWTPNHGDCDDQDADVHPSAVEVADGIDQDCDWITDEGTEAYDDDGDSRTELQGDCDDSDPQVYFGATDRFACDGLDQDCDGLDEPCAPLDAAFVQVTGLGELARAVLGGADLTGDGIPDLLTLGESLTVWSFPEGGALLDYGGRAATFNPLGSGNPDGLSNLGDVDQDGFDEVAVGILTSGQESFVYIVSAPLSGDQGEEAAIATLTDGVESSEFGDSLATGRDLSGDGVVDILIGAPGDSNYRGRAYLVSGDVRGLVSMENPLALIVGERPNEDVGHTVRFSGDNNGDGADDLLVGASGYTTGPSKVSWFAGPISGTLTMSDGDIAVQEQSGFIDASTAAEPGDTDGDGRDDLLLHILGDCQSAVALFTGGDSLNPDYAIARFDGEEGCDAGIPDYFGSSGTLVDVNQDGLDDLVAGASASALGGYTLYQDTPYFASGAAALFLAPFSGTRTFWEADRVWAGESTTARLGFDVANLGDVNADGFEDFALAAPYHGDLEDPYEAFLGAAYLMLGQDTW